MKKILPHYMNKIHALISSMLLLLLSQNLSNAALTAVGESLTSSIIANSGPQNQPNDTSNTVGATTVEASDTAWVIDPLPDDCGFSVGFGNDAGGVSAVRGKGKPNGPISVAGTIVHSSVKFELVSGQTANYDFSFDYLISSGKGAEEPTVSWSLVKVGGATIFSGSDSTNGNSSTGILIGSLSEAGEYELVITATLDDTSMPPNSSASASFQNIAFKLQDTNSTVVVPEPSGFLLTLMSMPLILKRRKR